MLVQPVLRDEKYYAIYFEANWADEINVEGFELLTEEQWNERLNNIDTYVEFPRSVSIGSNQRIKFDSKEDWLNHITVTELSYEEYNMLTELLKKVKQTTSDYYGRQIGFVLIPEG